MTDPMLNSQENEPADISENVEPAVSEKKKKEPFAAVFLEYLEILVLSICAVLIIFTFGARLCRVNGDSMNKTLLHGEMLLTTNLTKVEPGDIIVFHQTSDTVDQFNEPLVKRVIATEGQTVKINYWTYEIFVDGVLLEEDYVAFLNQNGKEIGMMFPVHDHHYDASTRIFEATVPEGCLFVMGDNRNNSADSRYSAIGFVDERRVLGKVFCRLKPFTTFD